MNVLAILAAALPLAVSSPSADEVREYFEIVYNPEVVYLEDGSVKAVASPFTAGRITPDWSGMTAVELGHGKHRKVEYHIPVAVERETWAYPYNEDVDFDRWSVKRERSERAPEELVVTFCSTGEKRMAVRYRVFDDLEVDVDPNTFHYSTVRKMGNGKIEFEDDYLDVPGFHRTYNVPQTMKMNSYYKSRGVRHINHLERDFFPKNHTVDGRLGSQTSAVLHKYSYFGKAPRD